MRVRLSYAWRRFVRLFTLRVAPQQFVELLPSYALQSLMAAGALLVILFLLDVVAHAVIVAALGSTAFIVFTMPSSLTARPRCVVGGHIMGLIAGTLCYFTIACLPLGEAWFISEPKMVCAAAISVGLSIFLMVVTDTKHPPASGTALGLVVQGWSVWAVLFVLGGTVMLLLFRWALRNRLRDLT